MAFPLMGMNKRNRYGAMQEDTSRQIWLFKRLREERCSHNQLWGQEGFNNFKAQQITDIRTPKKNSHQLPANNSSPICWEADPRPEDHVAHKENIAQELSRCGKSADCSSVQVERQRNGFHGDHHLTASQKHTKGHFCQDEREWTFERFKWHLNPKWTLRPSSVHHESFHKDELKNYWICTLSRYIPNILRSPLGHATTSTKIENSFGSFCMKWKTETSAFGGEIIWRVKTMLPLILCQVTVSIKCISLEDKRKITL